MPNHTPSLIIVDDEPNIGGGLVRGLATEADRIEVAHDADAALRMFAEHPFDLAIVDVDLPGSRTGLDLLVQLGELYPETFVLVMTAHTSVSVAVEAMRRGAFDLVAKPIDLTALRQLVRRALGKRNSSNGAGETSDSTAKEGGLAGIIGNCKAMHEVFRQVRRIAGTDATVLIEGESGTGKELIARAIHELSPRSAQPFVAVNLGALSESLLESELFGHEEGSFTGASRCKPGCFERAMGGTLFLDEVTEMSSKSQVDLLRVLETMEFCRVGGEVAIQTDVRIISATNRTVGQLVDHGRFREDLYYRLNVVPLTLPPLRHRREDIPLLVAHFLQHFGRRHGRPDCTLDERAMERLVRADWPGNVRQLRNIVERLVVMSGGERISVRRLPPELFADATRPDRKRTLASAVEAAEREAIATALAANDLHREQAARMLGVSVRTLHYKMSRYGMR